MLSMLLAYDAAGNVVETLDYICARDDDGKVIGLIDFQAHEDQGGQLTDIWLVPKATGSGTWPEWIGPQAHAFRVERDGGRIVALVHKSSGHRRERTRVEAEIEVRLVRGQGRADLRDLVGGPNKPMILDDEGKTKPAIIHGTPQHLPLVGMDRPSKTKDTGK